MGNKRYKLQSCVVSCRLINNYSTTIRKNNTSTLGGGCCFGLDGRRKKQHTHVSNKGVGLSKILLVCVVVNSSGRSIDEQKEKGERERMPTANQSFEARGVILTVATRSSNSSSETVLYSKAVDASDEVDMVVLCALLCTLCRESRRVCYYDSPFYD